MPDLTPGMPSRELRPSIVAKVYQNMLMLERMEREHSIELDPSSSKAKISLLSPNTFETTLSISTDS